MSHKNSVILILLILISANLTITAMAQEVVDCMSCHQDVRHGQSNNTFCINCHLNYELVEGKHDPNISLYIPFPHRAFDWEGDNQVMGGLVEDESCPACHIGGHEMISARVRPDLFRICEDCHVPSGVGPAPSRPSGWTLRSDIDSFIPKIYAHYNGSDNMDIDSQAGVFNGTSISSCFSYNVNTGQGTCHGVAEVFAAQAGGYFAHINDTEKSVVTDLYNNPSDPYQMDRTVDHLPDTSDCMFCHYQQNESIRLIWGGADQPTSEIHLNLTGSSSCWDCHTKDGKKPLNFHSDTMGEEEKTSLPVGLIAGGVIVLVLIGGGYYFISKKQG